MSTSFFSANPTQATSATARHPPVARLPHRREPGKRPADRLLPRRSGSFPTAAPRGNGHAVELAHAHV
jgi:hypothetical protein